MSLRLRSLIALKVIWLFTRGIPNMYHCISSAEQKRKKVSVFLSIQWKSLGTNVWFPTFFKIHFYVPQRKSYSQDVESGLEQHEND